MAKKKVMTPTERFKGYGRPKKDGSYTRYRDLKYDGRIVDRKAFLETLRSIQRNALTRRLAEAIAARAPGKYPSFTAVRREMRAAWKTAKHARRVQVNRSVGHAKLSDAEARDRLRARGIDGRKYRGPKGRARYEKMVARERGKKLTRKEATARLRKSKKLKSIGLPESLLPCEQHSAGSPFDDDEEMYGNMPRYDEEKEPAGYFEDEPDERED
jgi:hypothetical protein